MPKLNERIRAVAFDLDGTLIDTMGDLAASVNLMLGMLGAKELPEARVRALVGNGVETLVQRALNESVGSSATHAAQRSAALALFRRLYGQGLFKHSKVYPGVVDTLRALSEAGLALCCITNKDSAFAEPLLRAGRAQRIPELYAVRRSRRGPQAQSQHAAGRLLAPGNHARLRCCMSAIPAWTSRRLVRRVRRSSQSATATARTMQAEPGDVQPDGRVDDMTEIVALCVLQTSEKPHLKLYNTGAT